MFLFFLTYLSPVRQEKEIWDTFLARDTKFAIPLYRSMGVFHQRKESQALLDTFFQKILYQPKW